jgi:hypothetical protein
MVYTSADPGFKISPQKSKQRGLRSDECAGLFRYRKQSSDQENFRMAMDALHDCNAVKGRFLKPHVTTLIELYIYQLCT